MFTRNVGPLDRLIRVALGLAVLSLLFVVEGPARYAGLVGVVMLLTGLVGYCPLYTLLRINTCPLKGS